MVEKLWSPKLTFMHRLMKKREKEAFCGSTAGLEKSAERDVKFTPDFVSLTSAKFHTF